MKYYIRYGIISLLLFICRTVLADTVLLGSMSIGDDNSSTTLSPLALFNTSYQPKYPIHFSLSESGILAGITLNSPSTFTYGVTVIIWNSSGSIKVNATAADATPEKITALSVALPAGDYSMAVMGACVQASSNNTKSKASTDLCVSGSPNKQWEDISFTNITLTGLTSSSVNLIQRQHIGDNANSLLWTTPISYLYPTNSSGISATYNFSLNTATTFTDIFIYRMQDYGKADDWINYFNDAYKIRIKKTTSTSYDFNQDIIGNGDLPWTPNMTLSAGSYQLIIQPTNNLSLFNWFYDDIAWDDIVLKAKITNPVNHYQVSYSSNNITCEPAKITITACSDSNTPCTVNTNINSSVSWNNSLVALTNGIGYSILSHYASGSVSVGNVNSTIPKCLIDNGIDTSCMVPFVSSAFSFDFPTFYAGGNSSDIRDVTLRALQASVTNPAICTSLFAGKTVNVNFSRQNILPTTASTKTPILNGTAISTNTPVPLTFDSTGVAHIILAYQDAGVLGINASYSTTDTTAGTLSIFGSDSVAVLPDRIQLTAVGQTACSGTNDDDYSKCTVYKKAGETFTLSAQAGYGSSFVSTNNFTPESTAVKPSIEHKLLAPSAGTLPSSWTNTALTFSAGTASSLVSESDVGIYQYRVMPSDGIKPFVPYPTYQDETTQLKVPKSTDNWSDPVGRFVPAQLKAAVIANGSLTTDICANQTSATLGYTGQALRFATSPMLSVTALGSDGATEMKNYQGYFAKIIKITMPGSAKFVAAMTPKSSANTLNSIASWSDGTWTTPGNAYTQVYTFSANNQFTFGKTNTPVTPFETSLVVSTLTDSDDVKATSSLPLTFNPVAPDGSAFKVYSGRLTLDSVNAAETSALTLPFYMQYWNGSAYAPNTADNCSSLNSTYLQMNAAANWSGINLRTSNSSSAPATTNASLSPAVVAQGAGAILFTAPNNTGWVDISASSLLPLWMQDLSYSSGLTPARASFGYYRGNDRLIYRREVFGSQ